MWHMVPAAAKENLLSGHVTIPEEVVVFLCAGRKGEGLCGHPAASVSFAGVSASAFVALIGRSPLRYW